MIPRIFETRTEEQVKLTIQKKRKGAKVIVRERSGDLLNTGGREVDVNSEDPHILCHLGLAVFERSNTSGALSCCVTHRNERNNTQRERDPLEGSKKKERKKKTGLE